MRPNGEIWVVADSATYRPSAAFTDPDRLTGWLKSQSEEFLVRAMVYTMIDDPPDLLRGPTRYPMHATEVLSRGVLHA